MKEFVGKKIVIIGFQYRLNYFWRPNCLTFILFQLKWKKNNKIEAIGFSAQSRGGVDGVEIARGALLTGGAYYFGTNGKEYGACCTPRQAEAQGGERGTGK